MDEQSICLCVCVSMHDTVESLHADADCLIGSDEYCNMSVVSFHVDSNKVGVVSGCSSARSKRYVVCALCRRWSGTVSTQQWIPDVNSVHSEALVRPRSSDNGRG